MANSIKKTTVCSNGFRGQSRLQRVFAASIPLFHRYTYDSTIPESSAVMIPACWEGAMVFRGSEQIGISIVEGGADVEIGSDAGPIRETQSTQVIEPQSP